MTIEAHIIEDSISESGHRLVTWKLTYPRFIHSELMTHRVFSRNAASSRAIPTKKWITAIEEEPAMPIHWGANRSGMQASEQIDNIEAAEREWCDAAKHAVLFARSMLQQGIHKQVVNRILEPFMHMTVIVSGTDYKGFFAQRAHKDAQPEIQELACQMQSLYHIHRPTLLQENEWHLPAITAEEKKAHDLYTLKRVSAARMAAVSYLRSEDVRPVEDWLSLFSLLAESDPPHLSPLEHVATPGKAQNNFTGWKQLRQEYDPFIAEE